ncbi:MAG: bifunctional adenosylcobinamide kinase/adenosylcobinamide-phosphate guanylyltransferase [Cyanobacteria bacterium J06628_6]
MTAPLILVTGPARSGKSDWAEQLAEQSGRSVVYVATSRVNTADAEWQHRLEQHRSRRPSHWQLKEVPLTLTETIQQAQPDQCWLIDSLGTWLANWIEADNETWQRQHDGLLTALQGAPCPIILVAEETGWGVVPAYPVGRCFRDRLGNLTRAVGAIAISTYLVTCGYALDLNKSAALVTGLHKQSSNRPL